MSLKQSKANAMAELIQARLQSWPELEGVGVIIDRQSDVMALVAQSVAAAQGIAITILYSGCKDLDSQADLPRYALIYTVKVWGMDILQQAIGTDETPGYTADYVAEQCLLALRHPRPWNGEYSALAEGNIEGGDLVPDADYLVYELTYTVPVILGATPAPVAPAPSATPIPSI